MFCTDLCRRENPYGFCDNRSFLFTVCTFPAIFIGSIVTCPLWCPFVTGRWLCDECESTFSGAVQWSNNHRNQYNECPDKLNELNSESLIRPGGPCSKNVCLTSETPTIPSDKNDAE
jgi:hypothetical protein